MTYNFQITGIPKDEINHLSSLTDNQLDEKGILRIKVDKNPGYPCRVSLKDAEIGEEVLTFSYNHHNVKSPYRSSGPIFIGLNAEEAKLRQNEIPLMLNHRLLSLRVYNKDALMIDARTIQGKYLQKTIQEIFSNKSAAYIQVHNSGPGCYNCQINRLD